jgi:hypothetical protein
MFCSCRRQPGRQKLSDKTYIDDTINFEIGDSLIVISKEGKIRKLILPEIKDGLEKNKGTEKMIEILELFDKDASLKVFEHFDRRKLN